MLPSSAAPPSRPSSHSVRSTSVHHPEPLTLTLHAWVLMAAAGGVARCGGGGDDQASG
jgi:hypothetical protein